MRVMLSCKHTIDFAPSPHIGDTVFCVYCYDYRPVTETEKPVREYRQEPYFVQCPDCHYRRYYQTEFSARIRAEKHLRTKGHHFCDILYDHEPYARVTHDDHGNLITIPAQPPA